MKNNKKKSRKFSRLDIAVLTTLICSIVFFFAYNLITKAYLLNEYASAYFVARDALKFFSLPFILTVFSLVIYAFSKEGKPISKKFTVFASLISLIVLCLSIIINCNVWIATENGITYSTLFKTEQKTYDYDDIETVLLDYSGDGLRNRGTSLTYSITMNDGEEIEIQLSDSYSKDYNLFIEFDKKVSSKRKISGDFVEMAYLDELNNYYRELF